MQTDTCATVAATTVQTDIITLFASLELSNVDLAFDDQKVDKSLSLLKSE